MKNKLEFKNPLLLTDEEIDHLALFSGTYGEDADEQTKELWRNAYRKVEAETNMQIQRAGGIKNWYESGEGRLI